MKGFISEIQKGSVHDGPGLRTVVFLKGCNLRCAWCHNPETIYNQEEILFSPDKCIGCGACERGCFSGAKTKSGVYMDVEQVLETVLEDKPYYGNKGGITISGGEPLCQSEFVKTLLKACEKQNISTALETNLSVDMNTVLSVCMHADLIMCDVKAYDEEIHIKYTGSSNVRILENLYALDQLNIPIRVRTPIVCGVNNSKEEIENIANYLSSMKNLQGYELLTYHSLGLSKPQSEHFTPTRFANLSRTEMETLAFAACKKRIKVFLDNRLVG